MRTAGSTSGRYAKGVRLSLALTALALGCQLDPVGGWLERLSYDFLFLPLRPFPADEVIIIEMDRLSAARLDQIYGEWDRSLYAQVVDRLTEDRAALVVFDILLKDPPKDGKEYQDEELVRALQRNGRVILAADEQRLRDGRDVLIFPLDEFRDSALDCGLLTVASSPDKVPRQLDTGSENLATLGWIAAEHARTSAAASAPQRGNWLWLNYRTDPEKMPAVAVAEVFDQAPGFYTGKYVFLGDESTGVGRQGEVARDQFGTPRQRWGGGFCPGVRIHALTFLNLLRGEHLRQLPWWSEWFLYLGFGLVIGLAVELARRPVAHLALGTLAVLALVGALLLLIQTGWWFSWMTIAGIQVPVGMVASLFLHTRRLEHEKELATKLLAREQEVLDGLLGKARPDHGPQPSPAPEPPGKTAASGPGDLRPSPYARTEAAVPRRDQEAMSSPDLRTAANWVPPSVPDHTLIRRIGSGAYGQVWLAQDAIGTYHAVKFVFRDSFPSEAPYEREFKGIRRFTPISRSHPGLVHVLHVGRNPDARHFFYIMELGDDELDGQNVVPASYRSRTLATLLLRQGRVPVIEWTILGLRLASALAFLHEHRLLHRDIKPSNIVFVAGAPKLADVGLVTEIESKQVATTYVGTEGYIPPEGPGSPQADLYSLGKVLYEALTGYDRSQYPDLPGFFEGGDPTLVRCNDIVNRACEADAARRYQSADEMHRTLSELAQALQSTGLTQTASWPKIGRP